MMNLYLISQDANNDYDTYDSAVVAAKSEDHARKAHPGGKATWIRGKWREGGSSHWHTWCMSDWTTPENVTVSLIGQAVRGTKAGVVLASFNAG